MFEIENAEVKEKLEYPFADLDVGQGFFVPNGKQPKLSSYCNYAGLKLGRKFGTRVDHTRNGVVIFRKS